ncbi:RHS repeat-associated core domain-containing protein [Enterobacter mori]|uniref:RHS repeat-associated core domain-containing protein n=1 Tax=Enterobacter mori TaxID=539813 RepID=UPI001B8B658B|nr:RHS repeat-associated core domain-containing protein [Enterobacter mori]MBS3049639.1 RHS repeat-associated core domain-containing protein [Enterobacter mori]
MNLSQIAACCADTPRMAVFDARGLTLRTVEFNRGPDDEALSVLVTRYRYGARGEQHSCSDPRFSAQWPDGERVNASQESDLLGRPLRQRSVDSGEELQFWHADGQRQWGKYDGQEPRITLTYDRAGRPLTLCEGARELQRWRYGDGQDNAEADNLCGRCVSEQDGGGWQEHLAFDIQGRPLAGRRRFLQQREVAVDWSQSPEPEAQSWRSEWRHQAQGGLCSQSLYEEEADTERCLYQWHSRYNRRGQLIHSTFNDEAGREHLLLQEAHYTAGGACRQERLGNGVIRDYALEEQTRRMMRISTRRPVAGEEDYAIQDLTWQYDPVGNVTDRYDQGRAQSYFANERITAHSQYRYDASYRLRYASGRETLKGGDTTIIPLISDPSLLVNYQRVYDYDDSNNLISVNHRSARGDWRQEYAVSPYSNRSLPQPVEPEQVDSFFTPQGNLKALTGNPLRWNTQQRLERLDGVQRADGENDYEHYQYDGQGIRISKVSSRVANGENRTRRRETVSYLPGMRLCRYEYEGRTQGRHYSLNFPLAGHSAASWLYLEDGTEQLRFNCQDSQGSVGVALSAEGDIISREEFYPFGGASLYSARSEGEAEYKYYRYSGKERDNLSGLYDYGFRYYAPWLCRWISPDPLGMVDGPNLYLMVRNNPVTYHDIAGLVAIKANAGMWADGLKGGKKGESLSQAPQSSGRRVAGGGSQRLRQFGQTIANGVVQTWDALGRMLNRAADGLRQAWSYVQQAAGNVRSRYQGYRSFATERQHTASVDMVDILAQAGMRRQGYVRLDGVTESESGDMGDTISLSSIGSDGEDTGNDWDWDNRDIYGSDHAEAISPLINLNQSDFKLTIGDLPQLLEQERLLHEWRGDALWGTAKSLRDTAPLIMNEQASAPSKSGAVWSGVYDNRRQTPQIGTLQGLVMLAFYGVIWSQYWYQWRLRWSFV